MQDPYATTFGGFSKVTNFFRGALRPPDSPLHTMGAAGANGHTSMEEEPGFELITCVSEPGPVLGWRGRLGELQCCLSVRPSVRPSVCLLRCLWMICVYVGLSVYLDVYG